MKKLLSMLLATGMVLSLAACGGTGSSEPAATSEGGDAAAPTEAAVADEDLDFEYGEHFWSDEPVI